ncbi:imelysin family protein [Azorhizobium caulinodans]|nr:imelysin family protein [Azorhizobium caulinodans]
MIRLSRRFLLTLVAASGLPRLGFAADPKLDPIPLIEGWLLPRYDTLREATEAQKAAWEAFVAKPDVGAIPGLKSAFAKAADAWTAVEFITLGPASQNLRPDRFNFFPDRRNAISRAMGEIISDADAGRVAPDRLAQSSAGAQGFPALERLLFEDGAADALLKGDEAVRRRAYGLGIAQNLATMAGEIRTAWGSRTEGVLGAIVSGKGDTTLFPDLGALPGMFLTDLAMAYQRTTDIKILPVLGPNPENAKPLLADGWRAGRSGQVVKVMITSANSLLQEVAKQLPSRPQYVVNRAATAADKAAADFPADLSAAAQTAAGEQKVQAEVKVFKAAQLTVYRPIASYFGISLGFNALDGD